MTSYSTLVRKAKATKNPAARKKLLAQANKLRRESRKKQPTAAEQTLTDMVNGAYDHAIGMAVSSRGLPGHGELVGGEINPVIAECERRFPDLKAAIKAGKDGEAEIILRSVAFTGQSDGRRREAINGRHALDDMAQAHLEKIVSGFIANVAYHERGNRGGIPGVVTLPGYTVARIIDALRKAGWSESGYSRPRQAWQVVEADRPE